MSDKTRNLALISHGGAGKTTLTEMCLLNTNQINEPGSIDKGNTRSDFTPEEKDHKYSISNSYFSFSWKDKKVNLIDTPGYADFRGEVTSALRIVEGAVLLIDGTSGIEVNTKFVWDIAKKNNLARFIFVNKMDKDGANFGEVFEELSNKFDDNLVPLTIPCGSGEDYRGVIDLLAEQLITENGKEDIPEEFADTAEEYRLELIEATVELDDELMMKYLEDEPIKDKEIAKALSKGVKERKIVPLLAGTALNNSGVKQLLEYTVELTPSPQSLGNITAGDVEIDISEDAPFIGIVSKTMVDPYIGKLSIFRIYAGKLNKDTEIYVPRADVKLKTNKFYKLNGAEQETVEELVAGDIGAVAKMDELETSDTISSTDLNVELDKIEFPEPMLIKAVQSAGDGDDEKLASALNRISQEDPTFKVDYNRETKQMLVTSMGSVHLSVIKDICKRKFDVSFDMVEPRVAYRETIQTKTNVEEKYKKQSGGRGQYGHVFLRLEPLTRGKGFEFEEEIFGGAIPNQYIPAVEKGVKEAMKEGILAGYPVVDVKAVVYDGSYHNVDSSEMAFKIASSKAFKNGMTQSKPVLLEPIMNVEVSVPDTFMGDIMGDLNSRRGRIMGMDPKDGKQVIKAQVPQGEMFSYATDLKSITGGYGKFTMEFSHYDKVPENEAEAIIKEAQEESE